MKIRHALLIISIMVIFLGFYYLGHYNGYQKGFEEGVLQFCELDETHTDLTNSLMALVNDLMEDIEGHEPLQNLTGLEVCKDVN